MRLKSFVKERIEEIKEFTDNSKGHEISYFQQQLERQLHLRRWNII